MDEATKNLLKFWDNFYKITDEDYECFKAIDKSDYLSLAPSIKQVDALRLFKNNENIIDYGCGTGWASIIMAMENINNIKAVDLSSNSIKAAQLFSNAYGVNDKIEAFIIDENWLKKHELYVSYEPYDEYSTSKLYFAKLNTINNKPYYILCSHLFDSSYVYIISYDENTVTISNKCGADYGSVKIDINNNIVEVKATMFLAYYKIVDGKFELIERADVNEYNSEKEITELMEKYKNYNFVDIRTELTNNNIETYIK